MNWKRFRRVRAAALLAPCVLLATLAPVHEAPAQARESATVLNAPELRESPVAARGGYVVVVDLDENQLHFLQGRTILWSAPVATGMGLRLEVGERRWVFSTPTGEYQVQYKEENPVWYAPDWYFIENKLAVPPPNDPRRRFPGALGAAAVYIGAGLAIHGTDKPDLLGQRVSHGCIRLPNEYAQRLYHNVQTGTQVLIIGGDEQPADGRLIPGQVPGTGPVDARTQRLRDRAKTERTRLLAELDALDSEELDARLGAELGAGRGNAPSAGWPEVASVLISRAVKGDHVAAEALLSQADRIRNRRVRAEYATFLTDLYWRGSPTATRALARLAAPQRERVARALVEASLALYAGDIDNVSALWPTRRIPRSALEPEAQDGWDVIQAAEQAVRRRGAARAAAGG